HPSEEELAQWQTARGYYDNFFTEIGARAQILSALKFPKRTEFVLLPLQFSNYFGFRISHDQDSQRQVLERVLQEAPENAGVIVTQYQSPFAAQPEMTTDALLELRQRFPNLQFDRSFDRLAAVSQFIVPWASQTYSVSSTVGLQTAFFARDLVAPSQSHLGCLDHRRLALPASEAAALLQSRYSLLEARILQEPGYFLGLAQHFAERKGGAASEYFSDWRFGASAEDLTLGERGARARKNLYKALSGKRSGVKKGLALHIASEAGRIADQIDKAETVSFDVFDTLVTRKLWAPSDVFVLMGRDLAASPQALPLDDPDGLIFRDLRQAAEGSLRKARDAEWKKPGGPCEEITITEVYAQLLQMLDLPQDEARNADLVAQEENWEARLTRPKSVGFQLFDYARRQGKRVLLISDFIHPPAMVQRLLRECGYPEDVPLYVSSEIGSKKHSGALFDHVIKAENLDPSKTLHIGDNKIGDVKQANKKGLQTALLPVARNTQQRILRKRKFPVRFVRPASLPWRAALQGHAERYLLNERPRSGLRRVSRDIIRSPEEFGYLVLGPLVLAYTQWVAKTAAELGVAQIGFFARDCYLPQKIFPQVAESLGLGYMRAAYLPASRNLVRGMILTHPSDASKIRISDFVPTGNLGQLLEKRFGLGAEDITPDDYAAVGLTGPKQDFRSASQGAIYALVSRVLHRDWDRISPRYETARLNYHQLLVQNGIVLNEPTALVDIGYVGTITKALEPVFSAPVHPFFLFTYAQETGALPMPGSQSFLGNKLSKRLQAKSGYRRHNLMLETLLNEPVPSAAALLVDPETGGLAVERGDPLTTDHIATVNEVHDGVGLFVRDWYDGLGAHAPEMELSPEAAEILYETIMAKPSWGEAGLFDGLSFDNSYSGAKTRSVIKKAKKGTAVWPQSLKARRWPNRLAYGLRAAVVKWL
ncbi:MAG: HAD-IA family hydrolase, partial [Mangrovicoccus sp.]